LADKIPADWPAGKISHAATVDMLAVLRTGGSDEACDTAVKLLRQGTAPQSLWDGLFCGAAELLSRQPGIVALHAVTANDPHDYKFSVAAVEDFYHVSPSWRDRFLAASMVQLRGTTEKDNALVGPIRAAVQG
jgi:hypothetical protein